jgi:hypothetical protein
MKLVSGMVGSGKTHTVKAMLRDALSADATSEIHVLSFTAEYKDLADLHSTVRIAEDINSLVENLTVELENRKKSSVRSKVTVVLEEVRGYLLETDYKEQSQIAGTVANKLKALFEQGEQYGISFIVTTQKTRSLFDMIKPSAFDTHIINKTDEIDCIVLDAPYLANLKRGEYLVRTTKSHSL